MDRAHRPAMTGAQCVEEWRGFRTPDFADHQAIGTHAQRSPDELGGADSADPIKIGGLPLEPHMAMGYPR